MKLIKTSQDARNSIKNGIDQLAEIVKKTLGPKGRNVIISKNYANPVITNDGVTIAKEVQLDDEFENLGAQICRQVAEKTNDEAGDGTTTATILAQAIVNEGYNYIQKGVNAVFLQRALQKYGKGIVNYIKSLSVQISNEKQIESIATISANNDREIGQIISMAIKESGIDGVINIEDSNTMETWLERVDGMEITNGYISPYFATDTVKMQTQLEDVYILVYNGKIFNIQDVLPILKQVALANASLLILAEDVEGQALATLVVNKTKGTLNVCAVKVPGLGEGRKNISEDVAIMTGGTYFSRELNTDLKTIKIEQLGFAKKVIVSKDSTIIRQGAGKKDDIEKRIEMLKYKADQSLTVQDKDRYLRRIAKLIDGVSVIHIGAQTEMQLKEKKFRMEDALNATKAAIQEGIVAGAGNSLVRAVKYLDKQEYQTKQEQYAISILKNALIYPTQQILRNCGLQEKDIDNIIDKIKVTDSNIGYNAIDMELQDLMKVGIIDPVKVVRCALENAISISALFLTTQGIIIEKKEEQQHNMYDYYSEM